MKWIKNVLALCVAASLALGLAGCAASAKQTQPGALVIVGGGGTVEPIRVRALQLAKGPATVVVVLPQASSVEKRGEEAAQMWRDAGAAKSSVVEFGDVAAARAAIAAADLVWIGGGDQSQFMKEAGDAGLLDFLRERHRSGVVFGGTSAGAAVMSPHMLTGNPENAPEKLAPGSVEIVSGLGLFPGAIVDQHFVVRRRNNRLLSAVLTHPDHVGFGIDERTALIVTPQRYEVVGEGAVVVFDARAARREPPESGPVFSARNVRLDVLRSGDALERR